MRFKKRFGSIPTKTAFRGMVVAEEPKKGAVRGVELTIGERIETKVSRMINDNEPIKDGAPIVYTERKDGVLPGHNIRTDRFEVAAEAMDVVNKNRTAKSKGTGKPAVKSKAEDKPSKPSESSSNVDS